MENVLSAKEQESVFEIRTKRRRGSGITVVQFSETDEKRIVGLSNAQGPPVPIPNTEVKLRSAENTLLATVREDRSGPTRYGGLKRVRCDRQKKICGNTYGGVAQLGEHLPCKQGVMGSNPIISTKEAGKASKKMAKRWKRYTDN